MIIGDLLEKMCLQYGCVLILREPVQVDICNTVDGRNPLRNHLRNLGFRNNGFQWFQVVQDC